MSLIQGRGQRITCFETTQKLSPEAMGIDKSTRGVQDSFRERSELLGAVQEPLTVFFLIVMQCVYCCETKQKPFWKKSGLSLNL